MRSEGGGMQEALELDLLSNPHPCGPSKVFNRSELSLLICKMRTSLSSVENCVKDYRSRVNGVPIPGTL